EHDAGPYHQVQEPVAGVEPGQSWKQRVTGIEVLRVDRLEIITDRQNALGTDEAIDLWKKRRERDQVSHRQTTQENRPRHSMTVAALVSTVKNNRIHGELLLVELLNPAHQNDVKAHHSPIEEFSALLASRLR